MSIRRKLETNCDIDVGAFADIAFLLIIFFILTTSIMQFKGRAIDIPSSQKPEEVREEHKTTTIALSGDEIRYGAGDDSAVVSMDELRLKLEQENFAAKETSRDRMVIVESGDDVDWNRYFKVMTAVSNAGGIVAIVENEEENGAAK